MLSIDGEDRLLRSRDHGRCDNLLTIRRDEMEARALSALQEKLLRQDLFEEFCHEFTREMNRLRMEHRASLSAAEPEIEDIEVRRKKLIEMLMEGVPPSEVKDELTANAARREELKAKLAAAGAPAAAPAQTLEHQETRAEATEAARAHRRHHREPNDGALRIELRGTLRRC
jgi:hypothetical protein